MKTFLLLLLASVSVALGQAAAPAGKPYVRYAQFLEDTQVDLSDGSRWLMDKGDCFPIYMFKDQQKRVILQLGTATFATETAKTKLVEEKDDAVAAAVASYNKNLQNFAESQARRANKAAQEGATTPQLPTTLFPQPSLSPLQPAAEPTAK